MAEQGALGPLITLLTSQNAHVMFAGIGAIKSLMSLGKANTANISITSLLLIPLSFPSVPAENRARFVSEGGLEPLIAIKDAVVLDLSAADEDGEKESKPKDRRVQLEAGRVLVLLSEEGTVFSSVVRLIYCR